MSLFRNLNQAAIDANLNKNESKVFIVLMNQTLGYGKKSDHLTNKHLADLTGIRQDRLPIAIASVIDNGLFEAKPSRYYQCRYQIASKFLKKTPEFFTPHLPKNRKIPQKTENIPEIQNDSLKNRKILRKTENVPENRVDPPKFGILPNITLTSFNPTSIQPQQTVAESENLQKKVSLPEIRQSDVVVAADKIVVDLPQAISQEQQSCCLKALQGLTFEQQQRVINVYKIKEKNDIIHNPVGLFIVLAKAERNGSLSLPKSANTMISHPSHKPFVSDKEETQKKEENKDLSDHFGRLTWLKEAAQREGKPFLEFANFMQMNAYVEDPKMLLIWLKYHAKKDNQALEVLAKSLSLDWVLS